MGGTVFGQRSARPPLAPLCVRGFEQPATLFDKGERLVKVPRLSMTGLVFSLRPPASPSDADLALGPLGFELPSPRTTEVRFIFLHA